MAGPAAGAQLARRRRAVPEAKVFFHDLATDAPLPTNLITSASVAAAA